MQAHMIFWHYVYPEAPPIFGAPVARALREAAAANRRVAAHRTWRLFATG